VTRARELAGRLGFERSSSPETGRLLAVLAAAWPGGRLAEIGTGCGVGTAWLASGLRAGATLVSVELEAERAREARALLAGLRGVEVLEGDGRETLAGRAPFDLLFFDGGYWKPDPWRKAPGAIDLLADGGLLVADDMTPVHLRNEALDEAREFLAARADLVVTEVMVRPEEAVVLATRVGTQN
jgi:predicted O-methyltransferase YrrM